MNKEKHVYRFIFNSDLEKFVFRDIYECQIDPAHLEETGEILYLHPKESTTIKPEPPHNYIAIWDNDKWIYEENYKDIEYYDIETKEKVENPIYKNLKNYTKHKPQNKYQVFDKSLDSWVYDVELLKMDIDFLIEKRLNNKEVDKVEMSIESSKNPIYFDSNDKAINNISNLYNSVKDLHINNDLKFIIRTYNNDMVELSLSDLSKLLFKIVNDVQKRKQLYWKLKDELKQIKSYKDLSIFYSQKVKTTGIYAKNTSEDLFEINLDNIMNYKKRK